jgi:type VI secretion system secreted protein VgrG
MSMTSPLSGQDALIPIRLTAEEKISDTFSFTVEAVCQLGAPDPQTLLNAPICVMTQNTSGPTRYFHGIAREVHLNGSVRGQDAVDSFGSCTITAVPRLWFLRQTHDCRVYQNKSVKDILTAVFGDAGLTDFSFAVDDTAQRPYTVQFNETDYDFVLRLMEQEGWFYFFQHETSKHTLVITDKKATFTDITGATLKCTIQDRDGSGVTEWKAREQTVHGSVATGDYDPANPGTTLFSKNTTVLKTTGAATRDVYRWPASTFDTGVVEKRAQYHMEAAEAEAALYEGVTPFGGLVPGGKFKISNTPGGGGDDGTYVVRSVRHDVEDSTWMVSGSGTASVKASFQAFPDAVTWRQPMVTPRPRMDGIHTAIVMGSQTEGASSSGGGGTATSAIKMQDGGEEIHTDDLARVKIRFFWDHRNEASGGDAIWARVVQPWAGNGWGAQFLPRVGTEVAVAFVDGDPDYPIVLGGLYNGISSPIYSSTDKNKSGFRTRSSLTGDNTKFNELTFDDTKGSELIFIHAEKDLTTEVEHDETLTVDNCRVVTVKVDESITVQGKQTITITKDHVFEVTQGKYAITIDQGDSTFDVKQGNHTETISTGNRSLKVAQGNDANEVSMGNYDLKVSLGNITIKAAAGTISMEATQKIVLTVGSNSLTIDPTGVKISGTMVDLEGSAMGKFNGGGMLTLAGGLVKIN